MAGIWAFIASDSEQRADRFIETIEGNFAPLLNHPEMGTRRDKLADGPRVIFHGRYATYYQATASEIIIVRVVHGSRDVTRLFGSVS